MKISTIGLDLAKNVFQIHGVNEHGKVVLQKQLSRDRMAVFFAKLPPCLIGLEACGGAHYIPLRAPKNTGIGRKGLEHTRTKNHRQAVVSGYLWNGHERSGMQITFRCRSG